ncbi:hypothetical protein D9619_002105 [Psilocybe cf. subviscida]|uniref:GST C-terminal domain-containing protein n=1 Tax=Psilocybe cf. subviscida TaxID=2480587 RepID=A0A8H5BFE9_9AGAR|nr:hypothetical protein D9619_002105 [Psilocybe cf. subviscida]
MTTTTTRDTSSQSDVRQLKREADGSFKRPDSAFRNTIQKGGDFEPEKDRYHLYVAYSCPWATRTIIMRKLKGLENIIGITAVSPRTSKEGWAFAPADDFPGTETDPVYGAQHISELYLKADPNYSGRFTVPVLWDKKHNTIVNNESAEIIRIFNSSFDELLPASYQTNFYPAELQGEIDTLNEWVYPGINNGVYRAGFATSQSAYETAVREVFSALDRVEGILQGKDFLVGGRLTEADIRLFVTVIRFDPVYVGHYKCNLRTIRADYPAINKWMKQLYWTNSAFKDSTDFDHIKTHYYWSQIMVNPTQIVPLGPVPAIEAL